MRRDNAFFYVKVQYIWEVCYKQGSWIERSHTNHHEYIELTSFMPITNNLSVPNRALLGLWNIVYPYQVIHQSWTFHQLIYFNGLKKISVNKVRKLLLVIYNLKHGLKLWISVPKFILKAIQLVYVFQCFDYIHLLNEWQRNNKPNSEIRFSTALP